MSTTPLDRRALQRMMEHINHSQGNDGFMTVRVGYLVEFNLVGTDTVIHLPIDPYEPLPRWKVTQIIKSAAGALKEKADAGGPSDDDPQQEAEEGSSPSCEVGCVMPAESSHDRTEPTEDSVHIEEFVVPDTPPAL